MNPEETLIQFGWGLSGLTHLIPISDVVVIVDVLSFSTCVEVAVSRGVAVYPSTKGGPTAAAYAQSLGALLIEMKPRDHAFTFSPTALQTLPEGSRILLPSPNGSTLSLATGDLPTLTGCLRNARAVARAAQQLGRRISVIAAGERWPDTQPAASPGRPAGAGAIVNGLQGDLSGDAHAARAAFMESRSSLYERIRDCPSGQELIEKGRAADVSLSCELDQTNTYPLLLNGAYVGRPHPNRDDLIELD